MRVGLLSLSLSLAAFSVACGNKESAPNPTPEKVDEAKAKAPEAKPAPTPEAKAEPKPEEKTEAKVEAKPEDKPEAKADTKAEAALAPSGTADAKAAVKDTKTAAPTAGKSSVPDPKNGILGKAAADKLVKAGSRPVVHLLEAGSEPRASIAYALTKGQAKPFRMGMQLEMGMDAGAIKLPKTKMPEIAMLFDMGTGDKQGNDWPIDGKLTKILVEAADPSEEKVASALRKQLDPMNGFAVNYFVDGKGRVHDVKMKWPEAIPAQAQQMLGGLSQSIESMTTPLPEEEVGTGAVWEVIGRMAATGADILQVSTFKLKERTGDVVKLDVSVRQFAANDAVSFPGLPPGAKAKILSFNARGSGDATTDTKDIVPSTGTMTINTAMTLELSMEEGGKVESQKSTVETKTKVTYSRPAK